MVQLAMLFKRRRQHQLGDDMAQWLLFFPFDTCKIPPSLKPKFGGCEANIRVLLSTLESVYTTEELMYNRTRGANFVDSFFMSKKSFRGHHQFFPGL